MEGGDSSDFRSGGHAGFKKDDPIDKCDPGYYKPGAESFVAPVSLQLFVPQKGLH